MSKRKKNDPNPEEEEEDGEVRDEPVRPQKVYDFHKKTIEVYPERLRELNRQFLASISNQITAEPYSVLVGNCLDYVRQYFNYEDDLLQHTPWLAARLKQSHSDIVHCLQETIDLYDALARQDFDRLFEKKASEKNKIGQFNSTSAPVFVAPPVVTTSAPAFVAPPVVTTSAPIFAAPVSVAPPVVTTSASTSTSTTTAASSAPFQFNLPTATTNPTAPSSSFNFKIPTTSSAPPTTNSSPFAFSISTTGFGTSTFTSPSTTSSTDKPAISFATPPKFSFNTPTPATSEPAADENEDEPAEPPEPEKVDHEANAKFTYRCRMGVTKGNKIVKRGPVQVVLKEANDKNQLIVRSDDSLGRLFLNIIWSKMLSMKKNAAKDLTFVCALNPGMAEIPEGEFVTILFRFDNETERNAAYEQLEKERK